MPLQFLQCIAAFLDITLYVTIIETKSCVDRSIFDFSQSGVEWFFLVEMLL